MSARGLTAAELAAVVAELEAELRGAVVDGVARLAERDDLLLFLAGAERRAALHVALGAARARICLTRRRFPKSAFATGPQCDRLAQLLDGTRIAAIRAAAGERRATVELARDGVPDLALELELFGNRGLWCLRRPDGEILELSRLPDVAGRTLRRGAAYAPPPPREAATEAEARFAPPLSPAIDAHFTALDQAEEENRERDLLQRAVDRRAAKLRSRLEGLTRQLAAMQDAARIRRDADLLLAYGHGAPAGAAELRVPDPTDPGGEVVLPLAPGIPVHVQADRLYRQARKYEQGRSHSAAQRDAARDELAALEPLVAALAAAPDAARLAAVRTELAERGLLPRPAAERPAPRDKLARQVAREGFRRFVSAEGLPILVGRDNTQNDRLSVHVARGNDLWFHVGRGYAGSHVVVRLAKHQNASLETLLDAAALAVHFSKIRGAELCEVIYTRAKHVSKPKGLPPGRVVATATKSLRVRVEPERLARLLAGGEHR